MCILTISIHVVAAYVEVFLHLRTAASALSGYWNQCGTVGGRGHWWFEGGGRGGGGIGDVKTGIKWPQ